MKSLQIVELERDIFRGFVHKTWYFGKSVSEVMLSPNGMNVKHITHNCGYIRHKFVEEESDCDSDG